MTHFPVALRRLARGPWLTAVMPPHLALDPCTTLAGERLGTDWSVGAAGLGAALLIVVAAAVVLVLCVAGPAIVRPPGDAGA
jgi:hypothetical protein